jgi:hypothetical protein
VVRPLVEGVAGLLPHLRRYIEGERAKLAGAAE